MIDWTQAKPGDRWHFQSRHMAMFTDRYCKEWSGIWTERPESIEMGDEATDQESLQVEMGAVVNDSFTAAEDLTPAEAVVLEEMVRASELGEYTGGSVSYYTVTIASPTTPGRDPYTAECNDIIEALGMNYAEGNAFKAIWRRAAARQGKAKRGYTGGIYDAEKVEFFGRRLVAQEKANG